MSRKASIQLGDILKLLNILLKEKEKGKIRSIGISTHRIAGAMAARDVDEIEVIHPIINKDGIGIQDGTIEEMLKVIEEIYNLGKRFMP